MKPFLDQHFLLSGKIAESLYHEFAQPMPILDYHCHLSPQLIAEDHIFGSLTEAWLYGDHYKWRAMRSNGVDESYITGKKSDRGKFQQWAETVPYTMRNPLYHWTHLELQRYFDVNEILNGHSADGIFDECSRKLQTTDYSVRNLLQKMNVKVICTTDDPADSLEYHIRLKKEGINLLMLPAFRPDAAMYIDDVAAFNLYIEKLGKSADQAIGSFHQYLDALKKRHDFFNTQGCRLSDHGLEQIYAEDFSETEIIQIFEKARNKKQPDQKEIIKFKSAMLVYFAEWDHARGWVQQFHLGALRNNNERMLKQLGPDTGWDSIGDFSQARSLSVFLNRLDKNNKLAKTILYNLNPSDNHLMATMIGNFNDGSIAGKIQWGSAWWFLDQKDGMIQQMNALSNMGLLSRFVGMITDSRSFLSYPRHEYFRRILCNLFAQDIENGELPHDIPWIGKLVQDICFHNANNYFAFK